MAKRIIVICVWTVTFFLGSATLLLLVWRLYFALAGAPRRHPTEQTLFWLGLSCAVAPLALGLVGAVLGMRGLLPGTRRNKT
jgi:hypothetical protein